MSPTPSAIAVPPGASRGSRGGLRAGVASASLIAATALAGGRHGGMPRSASQWSHFSA